MEVFNIIFFLGCSSFVLYSQYKNDNVITNRWLYLLGWFMFVCTLSLAAINLAAFLSKNQYIDAEYFLGTLRSGNVSDYVIGVGSIIFGLYLYSLRKKCMTAELLPRTFRIWFLRRWHRFIYRKPKVKNKKQLEFNFNYE